MKPHFLFLALLAFASMGFKAANRDSLTRKERPKIGLVLSGGGAKGLAHVGVLKVLEDAGIQPDFITGTSMGAIIGALYASGYRAADLDRIVRTAKWDVLLSDQIPLKYVVPEEKDNYFRFLSEFNVSSDGIRFPAGFIQGQMLSELFAELTSRVAHIRDFDQLPIPFRCVAADLIHAKSFVFKEGSLALAMRASMSIPSVFTPVAIHGMYLVDGGTLDNYPVKLCKEMGADIIIGVNVGFAENNTPHHLNSITKVLMASASMGSNILLEEAIHHTDILIQPNLSPYNTASFFDGVKIMDLGMKQALPYLASLTALADSLNRIAPAAIRHFPEIPIRIKLCAIRLPEEMNVSNDFIRSQLEFTAGDSVTIQQINSGLRNLLGTRFFDQATYDLVPSDSGLVLQLNPVETHPTKLGLSIHYDNVFGVAIIGNLTLRNLLIKNSRLSLSVEGSKYPQLHTQFYTYLGDKMHWAFRVEAEYNRSILPVYGSGSSRVGTFGYRYSDALFQILYSPSTTVLIAPGIRVERHVLLSETGFPEIFNNGVSRFGNKQAQLILPVTYLTLDQRNFPSRGVRLEVHPMANFWLSDIYRGHEDRKEEIDPFIKGFDEQFFSLYASFEHYLPLGRKWNISYHLSASTFMGTPPFSSLHFAGGTFTTARIRDIPFVGMRYRERLMKDFIQGQTNVRFNLSKIFYATATFNGIFNGDPGIYSSGNPFQMLDRQWILGYGLHLSAKSIIGPVSFGMGRNNMDSKTRFYLNVGMPF